MDTDEILAKISDSDMVLVGLGEDFDDILRLRDISEYKRGKEWLRETGHSWLIPAWNEYCSAKLQEDSVSSALKKLASRLNGKNYYIVSTATDHRVAVAPWKADSVVMPCGTAFRKQCSEGCEQVLEDVTDSEQAMLEAFFSALYEGNLSVEKTIEMGRCSQCGAPMVLNNIYAEKYNEQGYMEQWKRYTKWLQGTLNHKLIVLELGVGMQFPSVIRWPFEKIAFFNNRAVFVRVHEKLYQLTEELAGKGCGIPKNAIDWLRSL